VFIERIAAMVEEGDVFDEIISPPSPAHRPIIACSISISRSSAVRMELHPHNQHSR
jgi:hypothetical protein